MAITIPLALPPLGGISFEDLTPSDNVDPPSSRCGDCHGAVYREWRLSSAEAELFEAAAWYDDQIPGHGDDLLAELA